ncbi:MAG: HD domain-containing protein [Deltaproteobacteria bacterium]|nr:HD domain-containing protein [Deltaproteobacteria bacterium]
MILRDPVHGLVSFEGDAERVVMALLETREVQRLRRVRQLGLTSLVFPGAEHSRFAHAIGAAHVMVRLLERIAACDGDLPPEARVTPEAARDAVAAALVHDLGHGPFSHLFEEVLPNARHHESWSHDVVVDPGTDVHRALESLDPGMATRVAGLLAGRYELGYLARAVSGVIDVDRCDYLLRDSHMTGARYGLYDLDWLLRALSFDQAPTGEWVLAVEGRKGLPPIEGYFLGRNFMYRQVYHHKATRAAECLIRAIFLRVAELVRDRSSLASPLTPVPEALALAARGETVTLGAYLDLDDARMHTCFADWERSRDPILRDLCERLRARKLPKTVPLAAGPDAAEARREVHRRTAEIAARNGMRPDLTVFLDETSDTPYSEPEDDSPGGVWVSIRHAPIRRLGDVSFLLGELRNKRIESARLIFPASIRGEVLGAIDEVTG